mmetsp:Transcript_23229/g.62253  ORF Transcript_23229/g.62253 Transcript_23229/m.62253 type:complete len:85 (-) Transcript_23229:105-359(-)
MVSIWGLPKTRSKQTKQIWVEELAGAGSSSSGRKQGGTWSADIPKLRWFDHTDVASRDGAHHWAERQTKEGETAMVMTVTAAEQ